MTTTPSAFTTARTAARWLDQHNGIGDAELAARIMKPAEEIGEAIAAWIGATGQNPRKGFTHSRADVAAELADVALSALTAIASLGYDPADVMNQAAAKVTARIVGPRVAA